MSKSFTSGLLSFHGVVLLAGGLLMYMKPSFVASITTSTKLPYEALSLISGWGCVDVLHIFDCQRSALVALGMISYGMSINFNFLARQTVIRGLMVGWVALAYGMMHTTNFDINRYRKDVVCKQGAPRLQSNSNLSSICLGNAFSSSDRLFGLPCARREGTHPLESFIFHNFNEALANIK